MQDQPKKKTCKWKEGDGYYTTSCGKSFIFCNYDGPKRNKFRFCPYCGKPIKEVK